MSTFSGSISINMSVAMVQAGTVLYDTPATMDKLEKYVVEAAEHGAKIIVFPEGFVGGYPRGHNFGMEFYRPKDEGMAEFTKYFNSAIEEHGPESKRMEEIAKRLGVTLCVGVVERELGTLYCSAFFYGPEKYLGKHRKLRPSGLERCIWGPGDGAHMPVYDTELGKIGAALCWGSYMPLYRVYLYSKGVQIYLAPTVDDTDLWPNSVRHIAHEGACYVISPVQYLKASVYEKGHPVRKEHGDDAVLIKGGSCAADPLGNLIVKPDYSGEMIRYVEIDKDLISKAKMNLDTVGHYSRPDIFQLHVNQKDNHNGLICHE